MGPAAQKEAGFFTLSTKRSHWEVLKPRADTIRWASVEGVRRLLCGNGGTGRGGQGARGEEQGPELQGCSCQKQGPRLEGKDGCDSES